MSEVNQQLSSSKKQLSDAELAGEIANLERLRLNPAGLSTREAYVLLALYELSNRRSSGGSDWRYRAMQHGTQRQAAHDHYLHHLVYAEHPSAGDAFDAGWDAAARAIFTEEHERRIVRCKSCRARIIWLPTAKGSNMPVDADTVSPEDKEFDPDKGHVSHFATCPQGDRWRKRTR